MGNVWDPTNVIQKSTVIDMIREQFPEIEVKKLEKIGEGFDNTVFKLNEEFLLRFPRREIAVSILNLEQKLLPFIKDSIGIQTTIPILFGKPSIKFPWPFLGYNYIKGKPPTKLNRNDRLNMIKPLAQFLKKLHSIPLHELAFLKLPGDELRRLDIIYRKPQLIKYVDMAINQKLIPSEERIKNYINNLIDIKSNSGLVLVHGDLHFKNVIVDEDNLLEGVIDWGDAHIGQRELDLSIVYSLIPSDSRESFYKIYGQVTEESRQLAKFKAIYTTILLLLFANNHKDPEHVEFCQKNLLNALS